MSDHEWPKTTPSAHVYQYPATYAELCSRHTDAAQADIEGWAESECPPEPTWEMVGLAIGKVDQLRQHLEDMENLARFLAMEHR